MNLFAHNNMFNLKIMRTQETFSSLFLLSTFDNIDITW